VTYFLTKLELMHANWGKADKYQLLQVNLHNGIML